MRDEKYNGMWWPEGTRISVRRAEIWRRETFWSGFRWGALAAGILVFLLFGALHGPPEARAHPGRMMAVGETQAHPPATSLRPVIRPMPVPPSKKVRPKTRPAGWRP